jgi:hypothetical protein
METIECDKAPMVNVLFPLPIVFQRRRPEMKSPIALFLGTGQVRTTTTRQSMPHLVRASAPLRENASV